jgi:hypothetical protein
MATRHDLEDWVYRAVKSLGGEAKLIEVAKHLWAEHESELRSSGDLFYTWQYDMRWAADRLRKQGKMTLSGRNWAISR